MWYDLFSFFYDRALEELYTVPRRNAVAALEVAPGSLVLDVACGTGQNFPFLQESVPQGRFVGIDVSAGMLRQADRRLRRSRTDNVTLHRADIHDFGSETLRRLTGAPVADGLICCLGMSVIPNWDAAVRQCLTLVKEGGRIALFDVYAPVRDWHTRLGEFVARSDVSRQFWVPLEKHVSDFRLTKLSGSTRAYGGELYVASGTRRSGLAQP